MTSLSNGWGAIATLVRGDEVIVRHFPVVRPREMGGRRDGRKRPSTTSAGALVAVDAIVRFCDEGGWRVQTISTPSSIVVDIVGRKEYANGAGESRIACPEEKLLGFAGRTDLLVAQPRTRWGAQHRRKRAAV